MLRLIASLQEKEAKLAALNRSQAVIEFATDGTILTANPLFLAAVGYRLPEVVGRHHSIFVDATTKASTEYQNFWKDLAAGIFNTGRFRRVAKSGEALWLQASYNPIVVGGKVVKVVKYATTITQQVLQAAEADAQLASIDRTQAIIQFNLDGTIITANQNFLDAVGYELKEIVGQHHRMFVQPADRGAATYLGFWDDLRAGCSKSGEFERVGKAGKQVWLQASYNPVLDPSGTPIKVIKFASDITQSHLHHARRANLVRDVDTDIAAIAEAISTTNIAACSAAQASQQTSENVQAVAAGSEQLVSSITEISRRTADASNTTNLAVHQAQDTNAIVEGLLAATAEIEQVVQLITSIAGQTNLLALNATIEAARAGEAGKGFAVVATEVKSLATQTTRATENIAGQIAGVQAATSKVVQAIRQISETISSIDEIATAIAAAVEEQGAVAREMSSNMQIAANSVSSISNSTMLIANAAQAADIATHKVKEATQAMAA